MEHFQCVPHLVELGALGETDRAAQPRLAEGDFQKLQRLLDAVRAEEHPGGRDIHKCEHCTNQIPQTTHHTLSTLRSGLPAVRERSLHYAERAMHEAPNEERPSGAVPDPADEEDNHDIEISAHSSPAVSAERDVEIFCEEAAQGHVPAVPELRDAPRLVWQVEVLRQFDADHVADTGPHVAVAGEIEIELQRVAEHHDDRIQPCDARQHRKAIVHRTSDRIRQEDFLRETEREEEQPPQKSLPVEPRLAHPVELRFHLMEADDRSLKKFGEICDIEKIIRK